MKRIVRFFTTMTGRIFVILVFGMVAAALIGTAITNASSQKQFSEQLLERTADRVETYALILEGVPGARDSAAIGGVVGGDVRMQPAEAAGVRADPEFQSLLRARGGVLAQATVEFAEAQVCFPELYGASSEYLQQFWQDPATQKQLEKALAPLNARQSRKPSLSNCFNWASLKGLVFMVDHRNRR